MKYFVSILLLGCLVVAALAQEERQSEKQAIKHPDATDESALAESGATDIKLTSGDKEEEVEDGVTAAPQLVRVKRKGGKGGGGKGGHGGRGRGRGGFGRGRGFGGRHGYGHGNGYGRGYGNYG